VKVTGHSQPRSVLPQSYAVRQFVLDYGVYISLGLVLFFGLIVTPQIYQSQTLFLILRQASQLGLVAIGQTLVMLVAGLDLSVSAVIVLTSVVIAQVSRGAESMAVPAILVALLIGLLIGLFNGLLVTKRNVPPFVATLGMLVLIQGAQLAYTQGVPGGFLPRNIGVLNQAVGPLPLPFILWMGCNGIFAVLLYLTPYGRKIYAVGSNRETARLSGIRVDRVMISVYMLCSMMAVVAGIVLTSYVGYVDRYLGRGFELDSIAAAVIGGTAFTGGRGGLPGTVAGVLLVQFLGVIMLQMGLQVQFQMIVKGVVVILAVMLYSFAARQD
jgi:ribose/xylose/arabinose/galactoside ABC-type transport system permease subunit